MLSFVAVAALALAAPLAAALPHASRQASGSCEATFPSLFTINTINTTLPNANATGQPIVFGSGGAIDGAEFFILSTWFSVQEGDSQPTFNLTNNGISNAPFVTQTGVFNGSTVGMLSTSLDNPGPAPIWCALSDASGSTVLSAEGSAENFSLCQLKGEKMVSVVYNATAANPNSFESGSCFPVILQITPQ